ncbi:MAG TPA: hypothetical protein VLA00_02770 [Xanthobacteraceae bacterium]|nr:hypothetical protein [Xanthobacteraceae bacterium]
MATDDPADSDPGDPRDAKAGDARSGDAKAAAKSGRRRHTPVLDLPATEVTPASDVTPAADEAVHPAEPAPETVAAAEPTPAPRPRSLGLVAGLLLGIFSGIIGGAAAFAIAGTFFPSTATVDELTDIEANIIDLRQRLAGVEQKPAPTALPEVTALGTRVDALTSSVASLEKTTATPPAVPPELLQRLAAVETAAGRPVLAPEALTPLAGRIEALEQRVDRLAASSAAADLAGAQLAALTALQEKLVRGVPFEPELTAARTLLGSGGDVLAPLLPVSGQGLPTGRVLAERLSGLPAPAASAAPAPAAAPAAPADEPGLLERLTRSAQSLLTVRHGDEPGAGPTLDARITEAQAALRRGNANAALAALAAVPAENRAAVAPVIAAIELRRTALADIDTLRRQALVALAGRTP